jgi:hypothetical protein
MQALKLMQIGNPSGAILLRELLAKLGVAMGRQDLRCRSTCWRPPDRRRSRFRGADGCCGLGHERTPGGAVQTSEVTVWRLRERVLTIHDE